MCISSLKVVFALRPPHQSRLTPCQLPLEGKPLLDITTYAKPAVASLSREVAPPKAVTEGVIKTKSPRQHTLPRAFHYSVRISFNTPVGSSMISHLPHNERSSSDAGSEMEYK